MTRREELEKVSELVFARMTNDTLKKIGEKYEEFIKEKTESEFERANRAIEEDNPEYGAIVVNLDGCELTFPFSDRTVITIDNGVEVKEFEIGDELDAVELFTFMIGGSDFIKVLTQTKKPIEFYNKDKLINDKEKVKITKDYVKTFEGVYPKSKVSAVYRVNGKLN